MLTMNKGSVILGYRDISTLIKRVLTNKRNFKRRLTKIDNDKSEFGNGKRQWR